MEVATMRTCYTFLDLRKFTTRVLKYCTCSTNYLNTLSKFVYSYSANSAVLCVTRFPFHLASMMYSAFSLPPSPPFTLGTSYEPHPFWTHHWLKYWTTINYITVQRVHWTIHQLSSQLSYSFIILVAMSCSSCSVTPGLNTSHHCLSAVLLPGTSTLQQCSAKYATAVAITHGGWCKQRVVWKLSWSSTHATIATWLLCHTPSSTHRDKAKR